MAASQPPTSSFMGVRAVLTGDIAQSTRLPRPVRAAVPDALRAASSSAQNQFASAVTHPIDVFRGDSWQLLVVDPALALRIAIYIRALQRASFQDHRVDTRLAIGFGKVDFVPETDISGGDGEAFRLSGAALDGMGRAFRMAVAASACLPVETTRLLDAVAKLIDTQAAAWTPLQAYAVGKALLGLTQEEIGGRWIGKTISQQTVAQHLSSAGWHAVEHAVQTVESILSS